MKDFALMSLKWAAILLCAYFLVPAGIPREVMLAAWVIVNIADCHSTLLYFNLLKRQGKDPIEGERNPVARWFMKKIGVFGDMTIKFVLVALVIALLWNSYKTMAAATVLVGVIAVKNYLNVAMAKGAPTKSKPEVK